MDSFSSEEESESESESDDDFELPTPARSWIDADSRPTNVTQKTKSDGRAVSKFETLAGVRGKSTREGDRVSTRVTGMKKLGPGGRAPTEPAPGHISLHSDKKGKKGGRKYNPNDQVSAHLGGMATMGVPATRRAGMSLDASPRYNRQHLDGHEKELLARERKRPATWEADSTVELEDPEDAARLATLEANSYVTKERARKRIKKAKRKSGDLKSIKSYETTLQSDRGDTITSSYGQDYAHLAKSKWFDKGYDPDNSSGDDDIEKGHI